jgi:threonyl-tRNA synthetase
MPDTLSIKLPDGSVREVARGTTPADIAAAIGPGLAKAALAARVDGEVRDLNRPLEGDAELALITARDEADALELVRHDFAHVLAEAVQKLFPGTQITFGPATDDGFYYDFAPPPARPVHRGGSAGDRGGDAAHHRRRRAAGPRGLDARRRRALFDEQGETFKAEWVMELPADETITMYRTGDWVDLCRGRTSPRRASSIRRRSG